MARDTFFKDYEVVEQKTDGNLIIMLVRDTDPINPPEWNWGMAMRSTYAHVVNSNLREELHIIHHETDDMNYHDFHDLPDAALGDFPDDTVCSFSMSGDEESEMRDAYNKSCAAMLPNI